MPFASKAQQRWAYANDPKLAKKLGKGTDYDKIPEKKPKKESSMPKLEDVYCCVDPRHDPEDPPMSPDDPRDKHAMPFARNSIHIGRPTKG